MSFIPDPTPAPVSPNTPPDDKIPIAAKAAYGFGGVNDIFGHWLYPNLSDAVFTMHLNQQLDAGTNPPAVQAILDQVGDYLTGAKLLGAGGGGFMLMIAKDEAAAHRIRTALSERPPNAKARFVNLRISTTGLQVTRS